MKALNNYIIFTRIADEPKKKSIILVDEEIKHSKGKVISTGPKCLDIEKDDIILIPRYTEEFILEGISYLVCKEDDLSTKFE